MLSAVSTIIETIKTIAYFSIYLSYNAGKIIVFGVAFCFETLNSLLATFWSFLVIVNEDLFVFLHDLSNRLCCIVGALQNLTVYISDILLSGIYGLKNIIFGTIDAVSNIFCGILHVITKTITGITTLTAGIKHLIVLFGSGVWFVVTLIPVFIVYLYFLITYYAGRAMEEIKTLIVTLFVEFTTLITDVVNFFIDVPFEAIAGLLICGCLVFAVVRFQVALYNSVNKIVRFLLSSICNKMNRLRSAFVRRRTTRASDTAESTDSDSSLDSDDSGNTDDILGPPDGIELVNNDPGWMTKRERYRQILQEESNQNCIICTEKSKCILLMPCRHLSTCKECTETLQRYQQNCPICRRYISYTIHVY